MADSDIRSSTIDSSEDHPKAEPIVDQPDFPGEEANSSASDQAQTVDKDAEQVTQSIGHQPLLERPAGSRKATPGDLALGGVLLALDTISTWVDQRAPTEDDALTAHAEARRSVPPHVLWAEAYEPPERSKARHATMGAAVSTGSILGRAGRVLIRAGDTITEAVARPARRSKILAPVRRRFDRLVEAGEAQVDHWAALGREQEERSRAITEATFHRAVDDSVDLLANEPHVQVIVQEIVAGQGISFTEQVIDEIRERSVTLDMRSEAFVGKILHRPPRESLPGPAFRLPIQGTPLNAERLAGRPDLSGQYAGIASRLLAFILDLIVLVVAFGFAGMIVTTTFSIFPVGDLYRSIFGVQPPPGLQSLVASILAPVTAALYWLVGWQLTGQTIGKLVMGIRVVGPDGEYPTFWRALRRLLGYLVIALSLGLGFLWILVDRRRRGWDDVLAGTVVVYAWHARPDETFLGKFGDAQ